MLMLALDSSTAFAQVDLSGQWAGINHSDANARSMGLGLVEYTVVPLNDEGRAVALSYSYSMLSMPERLCVGWSQDSITFAPPHGIMIERLDDPVTGGVLAWRISAGGTNRPTLPIWMDG